jgi:hypothetical protein
MIESETFLSLLRDRAHWEFEIFVTLVIDGLVLGILWPFLRKHWYHHLNRDRRDQIVAELHTEECPWCGSLKEAHSEVAWQAHQNFVSGKAPQPILRTHARNCSCDVCGLRRAGEQGVQS